MRGKVIYKVLFYIGNKALSSVDLIDVFISSGYGASIDKIEYEFSKKADKRTSNQINKDKIRKIYKYIYKLEKEGLISKNSSEKLNLTSKGRKKLDIFKKSFLLNKTEYKKEASNNIIVISYDIPIAFNKERGILRDLLKSFDFSLIHKSVWVGKTKLPKEFIHDLEKLGILNYIEILEVTKNGSLKLKN